MFFVDKVFTVDLFSDIEEVKKDITKYKKKYKIRTIQFKSDIESNAILYNQIISIAKKGYKEEDILIDCLNLINTDSCNCYLTGCKEILTESILCKDCLGKYLSCRDRPICSGCQNNIDEFYVKESKRKKCSICTMKIIIKVNQELCYNLDDGYKFDRKFIKFILSTLEYKLKELNDYEFYEKIKKQKSKS